MPWLELLVPALVLLLATPCVAVAYLHARSSTAVWRYSLLGFLAPSAGVSLFTAVGVFLRASGIVGDFGLYFVVWNLSFLVLTAVAYFAIKTAHLAVDLVMTRPIQVTYAAGTILAYIVTLFVALQGKRDLFFPYIGGTYSATSLYLFTALLAALILVLRRQRRLSPEDRTTLSRFLRVFLPLGVLFVTDQILRASRWRALPWPPLLPLAPLALYAFVTAELLARMRRIGTATALSASEISYEKLALAIAESCERSPLTPRERIVLVEILRGQGNAAIAHDLDISPHTVKNHVYNIFQKTGAGSRKELYLFAVRKGR